MVLCQFIKIRGGVAVEMTVVAAALVELAELVVVVAEVVADVVAEVVVAIVV